ncbi:hypothetical protein CYMTET_29270 [Cymbomonas tetramitiformis]|uniref:Bulb-type lectin domain-containing protein n=1 Tax=Cymbomonas tetramitiformis TaxID=36881 RepID=A0AAE0FLC3_9CHLO|nr:hypothetical protein CYMTET_29270 [Cymbomonas tetramitiformis]|eukprot:gene772-1247_t
MVRMFKNDFKIEFRFQMTSWNTGYYNSWSEYYNGLLVARSSAGEWFVSQVSNRKLQYWFTGYTSPSPFTNTLSLSTWYDVSIVYTQLAGTLVGTLTDGSTTSTISTSIGSSPYSSSLGERNIYIGIRPETDSGGYIDACFDYVKVTQTAGIPTPKFWWDASLNSDHTAAMINQGSAGTSYSLQGSDLVAGDTINGFSTVGIQTSSQNGMSVSLGSDNINKPHIFMVYKPRHQLYGASRIIFRDQGNGYNHGCYGSSSDQFRTSASSGAIDGYISGGCSSGVVYIEESYLPLSSSSAHMSVAGGIGQGPGTHVAFHKNGDSVSTLSTINVAGTMYNSNHAASINLAELLIYNGDDSGYDPFASRQDVFDYLSTKWMGECVGQRLQSGQSLVSDSYIQAGNIKLVLQSDGNLVLKNGQSVLWATGTSTGATLTMQSDGNLVLYTSSNAAAWASDSSTASSYLKVQTDGNLVIYSSSDSSIWASNTAALDGGTYYCTGGTFLFHTPLLHKMQQGSNQ